MKIITRLNVLIVSVVGLLLAGYLYTTSPEQFANGNCWSRLIECKNFDAVFALSIFTPIFVFSLLTYFTKEKVFRVWAQFTIFFAAIYIYAVLSASPNGSDGFSPTLVQTVLFVWIIYGVVAIAIVSTQLYVTRAKNNEPI